ncbi:hypothetical protein [Burkholderia mallei]|uniref:hypothetical protein n=1 Tax=Burkholderia mallei TaxID=13373 RepID=UPI0015FF5109|nr:hypothetical protein [Burkholderia mallei]
MRRQFARRREDRRDRATIEGTRKHENEAAAHDRVMDGLFAPPPPAASAAGADALCRAAVLYRCFARRVARLRRAASALALLRVSRWAEAATAVTFFPFAAFPVAVTVPVAVAVPADDDRVLAGCLFYNAAASV